MNNTQNKSTINRSENSCSLFCSKLFFLFLLWEGGGGEANVTRERVQMRETKRSRARLLPFSFWRLRIYLMRATTAHNIACRQFFCPAAAAALIFARRIYRATRVHRHVPCCCCRPHTRFVSPLFYYSLASAARRQK